MHLPFKEVLIGNTTWLLPIESVLPSTKQAHVLLSLTKTSLLSVGQLCNDNCAALFTKEDMLIIKNNQIISRGLRNKFGGLWNINFNANSTNESTKYPTKNTMNILRSRDKTNYKIAISLHACAGSPTIQTFQHAIKKSNFLSTWAGIHKLNMKYLTNNHTNISMGHLNQEHKNIQSTKETESIACIYNILSKIIAFSAKKIS